MAQVSVKDLDLSFGSVEVLKGLNLEIAEGEFLVLLGSSGCGKSTLLNCVAGLLDVTGGQIFIGDNNVTWAEPSERGIGMVFQSYALYPQMTVRGNMSFGLKNAGVPKSEIESRVSNAAEILQIGPLLDRKPAALSGGQRQRVAIGRALVRDVDVFLFDEPLSNLDAKLRADLRVEIKRLHQQLKSTMIYVTHDQIEALTLADRIAVMKNGLIQQLAPPAEIYDHPSNLFVARFVGSPSMNLLSGTVVAGADGLVLPTAGGEIALKDYPGGPLQAGQKIILGLRPEHIRVVDAPMPGSFTTKVDVFELMGSDNVVTVDLAGETLRIRVSGDMRYSEGDEIILMPEVSRASIFDEATEDRI